MSCVGSYPYAKILDETENAGTNTLAYFVKSRKTKRFHGINSYKTKLEYEDSPSNELDSVRIFSLLKRYNLLDNVVTSYVRRILNLEHIILTDFKL